MTDERLQRLLGGASLAALRKRLRQRYELAAASERPPETFRIGNLAPEERDALAALQGQRPSLALSIRVDVPAVDAALLRAGVAASLRDALERLDGPIANRAAERDARQTQWLEVWCRCTHPTLLALLQTAAGTRLAKRVTGQDPPTAATLLAQAEAVLCRLPAPGVTRAQLAAGALGDAHALDASRPVATLVLAALRHGQAAQDEVAESDNAESNRAEADSAESEARGNSARDLWAGAGVLVNELARPALFLNLPVDGCSAIAGEPAYLSLRALLRSPPRWRVERRTVYVCENPNLLAIAADHLGPRCAPLVCTDGMPAAAQRSLLSQLAQAGADLRYHGDFDWPGLRIGIQVMTAHGAAPWRFGAADYRDALRVAPRPGRLLQGADIEAPWDAELAAAMRSARRAVDEEMVAASLLEDLARPRAA